MFFRRVKTPTPTPTPEEEAALFQVTYPIDNNKNRIVGQIQLTFGQQEAAAAWMDNFTNQIIALNATVTASTTTLTGEVLDTTTFQKPASDVGERRAPQRPEQINHRGPVHVHLQWVRPEEQKLRERFDALISDIFPNYITPTDIARHTANMEAAANYARVAFGHRQAAEAAAKQAAFDRNAMEAMLQGKGMKHLLAELLRAAQEGIAPVISQAQSQADRAGNAHAGAAKILAEVQKLLAEGKDKQL
ncbi:MAG: hypothetical protein WAX89_02160 [Alphaproteobacteria bacterium]